jgi:PAS domain-containing protein
MSDHEGALHFQPEWCGVALASIGDAVITTDTEGRVTSLNSVAESLTGRTLQESAGQPLDSVFRIINEESHQPVGRLPLVLTAEPQPSSPPSVMAKPPGRSMRGLVVNDNVDAVTTLALLLRKSGHDIRTAHYGSTALEAALDY